MGKLLSIIGKRMTKRRKIVILIIAAAVLFSVNGYFLYRFYQNYRIYGTIFKPRYTEIRKAGNPIVKGIYEYKNDTGLFPYNLKYLVPEYIEEEKFYYDGIVPKSRKNKWDPIVIDGRSQRPDYSNMWHYYHDYEKGFRLSPPWKLLSREVPPSSSIRVYYDDYEKSEGWYEWRSCFIFQVFRERGKKNIFRRTMDTEIKSRKGKGA